MWHESQPALSAIFHHFGRPGSCAIKCMRSACTCPLTCLWPIVFPVRCPQRRPSCICIMGKIPFVLITSCFPRAHDSAGLLHPSRWGNPDNGISRRPTIWVYGFDKPHFRYLAMAVVVGNPNSEYAVRSLHPRLFRPRSHLIPAVSVAPIERFPTGYAIHPHPPTPVAEPRRAANSRLGVP